MTTINNPRSILHAITPTAVGTSDVESLTSYFCRLAYSHGMTARNLGAWILARVGQAVPDDFKWSQRSFSSMSSETEQWAAWIAELTAVGDLDRLTLVPWRQVMAGTTLAPRSDHWCPQCLAEDHASGLEPYLRLSWDVAPFAVCTKHKVALVSTCPHCGRSNVRNRAAVVVPGYCTFCGGFLGDADASPATPEALWSARQIGLMLARQPTLPQGGTADVLKRIIERMAGGQSATFARRLGLSKSGLWHCVAKGGLPTLQTWLAVSLHSGLGLDRLFSGDLDGWVPPIEPQQMIIPLPESPRTGIASRRLDWEQIRAELQGMLKLPEPITLAEACKRVGVEYKQLYLRANQEARMIADRHRQHRLRLKADREDGLRARIAEVLDERLMDGYEGVSAREIRDCLDGSLKSVRNSFTLIREVRDERLD